MIKNYKLFLESLVDHGDKVYWGSVAAGILPICTKTKRILVNLRSEYVQEPLTYGVWGGKVDDHDADIKVEAIREFIEETMYDGDIKLIDAYIYKNPSGTFTYYNYIGLIDDEFEPNLDWESKGYEWLTFDELIKLKNKHFGLVELIKNSKSLIKKYS